MASLFKKLLGIAPTADASGNGFIPSPLGRLLGVASKSDYAPADFGGVSARGDVRVLVLCTERRYFTMTNGAKFSTGHNVVETAVPLMHLHNAGFDFDVVTPTGAPAILEDWSSPQKDAAVLGFIREHKAKFDKPLSLVELFSKGQLEGDSEYAALFLPGGHGAMVGLPEDENVGRLIRWVHATDRYLVAVCHGPAAMVAAADESGGHPYQGYELCAFPDRIDKQSPSIGYLPGPMPWFQCEELERLGMRVINSGADGETHADRKLLSGDSPKACDKLGRMITEALLAERATSEGSR